MAHWSAWRLSGVPIPSIVVICENSGTFFQRVMQERTTLPLSITLQTPHWPQSQPRFVPVILSWSRSTVRSDTSGLPITRFGTPLMIRFLT